MDSRISSIRFGKWTGRLKSEFLPASVSSGKEIGSLREMSESKNKELLYEIGPKASNIDLKIVKTSFYGI